MNSFNIHDNTGNYSGDDGTPYNTNINKSYLSDTGSAPASSSKAVLAALRALQDKIRRLESERTSAIDETVQLRHQLKNLEIESEHIKQREILSSQKTLQDARTAYEKLLNDKNELELKINKVEEKNQLAKEAYEQLERKVKGLEDEKAEGMQRIQSIQHEQQLLQSQLQETLSKEKGMCYTYIYQYSLSHTRSNYTYLYAH